jgi:CHASE3 domain sensor protein
MFPICLFIFCCFFFVVRPVINNRSLQSRLQEREDSIRLLHLDNQQKQARIKELEDTIKLQRAEERIAMSYGRNTEAVQIAEEITKRRGQEWRGVEV